MPPNIDERTVRGFGREWQLFTHAPDAISEQDQAELFNAYFAIFPWHRVGAESVGADIGCGSGRWARLIAPRVGRLIACDASSDALAVARRNLAGQDNVDFHVADIDNLPMTERSLDFAYCLGVLHHVPDTARAIAAIARKLKPGAPFLSYIYYAFDNQPRWYRWLWSITNGARLLIARLPLKAQVVLTTLIAVFVYWPLARIALALEKMQRLPNWWPLAFYRAQPLYVMRTDAFDRFCTRLERRFTRQQIAEMLQAAGLENATFSTHAPFWCAIAFRRST